MSNKYPQYFTANGLERRKKRPLLNETAPATPSKSEEQPSIPKDRLEEIKKRVKQELAERYKPSNTAPEISKPQRESSNSEIRVVTTPAPKVNRKKRMIKRAGEEKRSISPAAAKAIAEALKSMLHS